MDKNRVLEIAQKETEKLLDLVGVNPEVEYNLADNSNDEFVVIGVSIKGEDLGFMIGNHGRHLQAFQSVLNLIVRNIVWKEDENFKFVITVDAGDYRKQRMNKVEQTALQKADDARILGEPVDLMPMNPAERRVVHTVLGKFDDIKTESHGEGRDRFVRILPVSEKDLGITSETEDNLENEEDSQE
ncbi:MAG TPA: R3H domain-containing nucleic acid-binding protein [Candidatus Dojkabacteria bacterium]|nr:R3H domain-containing nucleic acid-binding protein [Candidatus Dojkabacteria bacterium]